MTEVIIFGALVVYLIERLRPLAERWVGAREKQMAQPKVVAGRLPSDLQIQAQGYRDSWARADAEKRFRELYEELGGDWDQVRSVVGEH